jgi:hypothetical protein
VEHGAHFLILYYPRAERLCSLIDGPEVEHGAHFFILYYPRAERLCSLIDGPEVEHGAHFLILYYPRAERELACSGGDAVCSDNDLYDFRKPAVTYLQQAILKVEKKPPRVVRVVRAPRGELLAGPTLVPRVVRKSQK